jgi:hypothetical protein
MNMVNHKVQKAQKRTKAQFFARLLRDIDISTRALAVPRFLRSQKATSASAITSSVPAASKECDAFMSKDIIGALHRKVWAGKLF